MAFNSCIHPIFIDCCRNGLYSPICGYWYNYDRVYFLLKHQPWRYIGFILFAATFHKSAIVMLIFLPLDFLLNIGRIFFILMFVTGAGLLFIMERLSGMWDLYINQGMESDGGLLRVLLNVLPAMCFLILRKKWQIRWPDSYRFLLWLSVAALLLLPLQFWHLQQWTEYHYI